MANLAAQAALNYGVRLRFLEASDKSFVKKLCQDWFPIEYPEEWYADITSDKKYFTLAAVLKQVIVGLIVAEVKPKSKCHKEDQDLLSNAFPPETKVAYILSLGVAKDNRENGVGSLLLHSLMQELSTRDNCAIKAVYLHVLSTNHVALRFYENRGFRQHKFIPNYYYIGQRLADGWCYVTYLNGGQSAWSMYDYVRQVTSVFTRFQGCSSSSVVSRSSSYASQVMAKLPKVIPSLPNWRIGVPFMGSHLPQEKETSVDDPSACASSSSDDEFLDSVSMPAELDVITSQPPSKTSKAAKLKSWSKMLPNLPSMEGRYKGVINRLKPFSFSQSQPAADENHFDDALSEVVEEVVPPSNKSSKSRSLSLTRITNRGRNFVIKTMAGGVTSHSESSNPGNASASSSRAWEIG